MPLVWAIALVVAVVAFRVWAGVDAGLAAALFKRWGKRTTLMLCTVSVIGAALAIYLSRR
jgi:cytochrome bd-type quinol oxidase subunit 2